MQKKPEILITITQMPLAVYLFRIICLAWIGVAIFMYAINPFFFGLTIGFSIFLILLVHKKAMILTQDTLELHTIYLLPFFNKVKAYQVKEMVNIGFEKGEFSLVALFLELLQPTTRSFFGKADSYLWFELENGSAKKIRTFGGDGENEKLVVMVKKIVQKLHNK